MQHATQGVGSAGDLFFCGSGGRRTTSRMSREEYLCVLCVRCRAHHSSGLACTIMSREEYQCCCESCNGGREKKKDSTWWVEKEWPSKFYSWSACFYRLLSQAIRDAQCYRCCIFLVKKERKKESSRMESSSAAVVVI